MTRTRLTAFAIVLLTGLSATASAATLPEALGNIPSDYAFVAGVNVRQVMASPFFAKMLEQRAMGKDLAEFTARTGLDPARDVDYLLLAGRNAGAAKPEGLMILSGTFDREKILGFFRTGAPGTETEHAGTAVLRMPGGKDGSAANAMAFLGEREIALGDLESLEAALDTRSGAKKSVLTNAALASLIGTVDTDAMFWFAAESPDLMKAAKLPFPPAMNASPVKSAAGSFHFGEDVAGTITATAADAGAAAKMAEMVRAALALGQMQGAKSPELGMLLRTFTVTQDADRVGLSFDIPGALLQKLSRSKLPLPPGTL